MQVNKNRTVYVSIFLKKEFVVPVVLGGSGYADIAPPNSYIDVRDFSSTQELAQYLQHLIDNPDEYLKYFWWKPHYQVNIVP